MLEFLFPFGITAFFLAIVLPLIGSKLGNSKVSRQASLLFTSIASVAILAFALEIVLSNKSFSLSRLPNYAVVPVLFPGG